MESKQLVVVKICTTNKKDHDSAHLLAERLSLQVASAKSTTSHFYLKYNNGRLELHENLTAITRRKGLWVDFLSGPSHYRYKFDRTINQPLAKAVGIKPGFRPDICDLTAGFGGDGFVLASLGCNVILVERSPIIFALLEDGLKRAKIDPKIGQLIQERLSLYRDESFNFLTENNVNYETIYLDPMYPHQNNKALNKLKMRFLREIVGDDQDSHHLIKIARQYASKRVVVKRPAAAEVISEDLPSYSVQSKKHRYDIYLTPHL